MAGRTGWRNARGYPPPDLPHKGGGVGRCFRPIPAKSTGGHLPPWEIARGEATRAALSDLSDLALAVTPSRERWLETTITGDNYALAARHWPSGVLALLPQPCPYPVAVGAIAAAHGIDLEDTLLAWLTATVHGQVSVAVRLVPLGQSDGLKVMSGLEPCVAALAKSASTATLADIGAIAYAADIAQMRHETLEPRIFRS